MEDQPKNAFSGAESQIPTQLATIYKKETSCLCYNLQIIDLSH